MTAAASFGHYRSKKRFDSLDGLRCFAIVAVLFHHSVSSPALIASRGFLGVDFFFAISGFLITTLLLRERDRNGSISLRGFYRRRVLRILPLYYAVVTLLGGYYVLIKHHPGASELWPWYYLFFANFLVGDIPLLSPTWSLSVEEQYYLFWPVFILLFRPRTLVWGISAYVLLMLILNETGLAFESVGWGPLSFTLASMPFSAIFLGAAVAIGLHYEHSFSRLAAVLGRRWSAPLSGAFLVALLFTLPRNLTGWPALLVHVVMAIFLGAMVIREDTLLAPLMKLTPVARVGAVSYGIYLLHHIAGHVARLVVEPLGGTEHNQALYLFIFWGGAWGLAELSFRFYEQRFLALRHKGLGSVRSAPPPAQRRG